jgi:hypothetical protein
VNSLISSTLLLPAATALTTPQKLVVKGKITVDVNYTFAAGSEIVFLDGTSGIKVSAPNTLTLSSSHLHGCQKMWLGIEAAQGSVLYINGTSIIEDAKIGVTLRNNTKFSTVGCTYRKNVIGILMAHFTTNDFDLNVQVMNPGFYGNLFEGAGALKEPVSFGPSVLDPGLKTEIVGNVSTSRPVAGVWIERVSSINIGYAQSNNTNYNLFNNFGQDAQQGLRYYGIYSAHTNLSVTRSKFSYIGQTSNLDADLYTIGTAIRAYGGVTQSFQTNYLGLLSNSGTTPPADFSNCEKDISIWGTSLNVENFYSELSLRSISMTTGYSLAPQNSCSIKNSRILSFLYSGILVDHSTKAIPCQITNNTIWDVNNAAIPFLNSTRNPIRMYAQGATIQNLNGAVSISGNTIEARSGQNVAAFRGIALKGVTGCGISGNLIKQVSSSANINLFRGITADGPMINNTTITDNTIIGNGLTNSVALSAGISLFESVNCFVTCNSVDKINLGHFYDGLCSNMNLAANTFNQHSKGLLLLGEIGVQQAKFNSWPGSISTVEAEAATTPIALASQFRIAGSNPPSNYWAQPRIVGGLPDPGTWFIPVAAVPFVDVCGSASKGANLSASYVMSTSEKGEEQSMLSEEDKLLMIGKYSPLATNDALKWEYHLKLVIKLLTTELQLDEEIEMRDSYIAENADSDFYQLGVLYSKFVYSWQNHPDYVQLHAASEIVKELVEKRFQFNEAIIQASETKQLFTNLSDIDHRLISAYQNEKAMVDNWFKVKAGLNQSDLETCRNIVTSTETAQLFQKYLEMVFLSNGQFSGLNQEQKEWVRAIAQQCRYELGYPVLVCRTFSDLDIDFQKFDACASEERTHTLANEVGFEIEVQPNPASNLLQLHINKSIISGRAEIISLTGSICKAVNISGEWLALDISGLENGIYTIRVKSDDGITSFQKFVKQ